MLLAFDIGNSGISFGVFDITRHPAELCMQSCVASDQNRSKDEYIVCIRSILELYGISPDSIDCAAISSVVPELTSIITETARYFSNTTPLIVGPGVRTGLNIRIDQPTQLGADIVANTVAALCLVSAPAVIVDFGTATTLSVVDSNSTLIGTIICPGIKTAMKALSDSASQLNNSGLIVPKSLVGKNTEDSVNSGILNGHILMVDAFIRELRQALCAESTAKLSLVATGGLADYVVPYCRNKFHTVPALTLCGIAEIYMRNFTV